MKNKIYSSLLVIAVALIGFFVVPVQGYSHNGSSQHTWELTYCNTPDGGSTTIAMLRGQDALTKFVTAIINQL